MNIQVVLSTIWAAVQPLLGKLMQDPAFQAVLQKILADIVDKIAKGVHPDTAVQQAQGQIGAAALLHLTGNFGADLQSFLSGIKPLTDLPPAPTPTGKYSS